MNLRSRWILPTGNWRPALLERDLALPFTLPPLPRPDILLRLESARMNHFILLKFSYMKIVARYINILLIESSFTLDNLLVFARHCRGPGCT